MATKNEPRRNARPKREEFSDFALVLKDGTELQCHKVKLADVSPFFCAMFRQDCEEMTLIVARLWKCSRRWCINSKDVKESDTFTEKTDEHCPMQ